MTILRLTSFNLYGKMVRYSEQPLTRSMTYAKGSTK
jgi:hypothetical protein